MLLPQVEGKMGESELFVEILVGGDDGESSAEGSVLKGYCSSSFVGGTSSSQGYGVDCNCYSIAGCCYCCNTSVDFDSILQQGGGKTVRICLAKR